MAPVFEAREFRRRLAAFSTGVAIVSGSSLAAFARAKYFAINVLTADQRELSPRFSSTVADKFDGVGAVSGHGAIPLITGCVFDRANVRVGGSSTDVTSLKCDVRCSSESRPARHAA